MARPALLYVVAAIFLIGVVGCAPVHTTPVEPSNIPTHNVSDIQELVLTDNDLQALGIKADPTNPGLNQSDYYPNGTDLFPLTNGTNCQLEESLDPSDYSNFRVCYYRVTNLSNTTVGVVIRKHTSLENANHSFDYDSHHYYASDGVISENDIGAQSLLRVNNKGDFGYMFVPFDPNVYTYTLYLHNGLYVMQIFSNGSDKDAVEYIKSIGHRLVSKFE